LSPRNIGLQNILLF